MISHFNAEMVMRYRQIEMERTIKSYQYRAARGSMPEQSRISKASAAISSLIGKGRVQTSTTQPAC
jgi:hypothetical protein